MWRSVGERGRLWHSIGGRGGEAHSVGGGMEHLSMLERKGWSLCRGGGGAPQYAREKGMVTL